MNSTKASLIVYSPAGLVTRLLQIVGEGPSGTTIIETR